MELNKSSVRVVVSHRFYNDGLDIGAFIDNRREAFEAVAPLPPSTKSRSSVALWTESLGWGDADIDWSSTAKAIAEHTKRWVGLLADFVVLCREIGERDLPLRALKSRVRSARRQPQKQPLEFLAETLATQDRFV
jgi:hypothetical protein